MIRLAAILLLALTQALPAFADDADAPTCNARRQGGVDKLMESVPGHDRKCYAYGMKLVRDSARHYSRLQEAEYIFETLLHLRPQSPFAFIGYAEVKMRKRELGLYSDDSIDAIHAQAERATRIKPVLPESYVTLGRADLLIGCLPCAERSAAKAEELGVEGPDLKLLQSSIAERGGKQAEAEAHLREALSIPHLAADRRGLVHLALAELLARARNFDGSEREFRNAAGADPSNVVAQTRRAEVLLFERGDVKAAMEAISANKRVSTTLEARKIRAFVDYFQWSEEYLEGRATRDIKRLAQVSYVSPEVAFITCARYPALSGLFEAMLRAGVVGNLEERDDRGNTALLASAAGDNRNAVRLLVSRGANVNAQNDRGERALTYLVRNRSHEALTLLLGAGADAHYIDRDGRSPLILAALRRDSVAVTELLRHGAVAALQGSPGAADPLSAAAMVGDVTTTRLLLNAGIEVDSTDRHGRTALLVAVFWGNSPVAKLLVERGADPRQALNLARDMGNQEMVELLRAAIKHAI